MPRIRAATIEEHKALTRRQILVAAQEMIAESGSADLSLGDVAAEVGIGRTTFYEYFRDRDDLIASLVEATLPEVIRALVGSVPAELPASQRLRRLAVRTVEFVATDAVLGLILHRELPRLSARAQERIRRSHAELGGEFGSIYRRGVAEGEFRPMPADLAGLLIQDVIMGAARALIAAPDPAGRLAEVTESTVAFLLKGLAAER